MKKTAFSCFLLSFLMSAAAPLSVLASGSDHLECRFTETRGNTGGGGTGSARTCRAVVMDSTRGDEVEFRVRCSSGFRLLDEHARQFKRDGDEFTVGEKDDRIAVLRLHDGRHATLVTSSDPVQGYMSQNDRYRGVCREMDSP